MSFGSGFGSLPYGYQAPANASSDPVRLHSARFIEALTGDYAIENDGEFRAMNGTAQRVLLTVARVMYDAPDRITPASLRRIEQDIDAALRSTVSDAAEPESVAAARHSPGAVSVEVTYRDLGLGTIQTARASL